MWSVVSVLACFTLNEGVRLIEEQNVPQSEILSNLP